ncbi:MAG: MFS transporter, partial [Cellulomonadaceae bacterium]|nr:MFS transporter [Cellulomonadaceae bacterium]
MPHTPTSPPAPPQPGEQAAAQTTAPPAPQPAPQPAVPRRAWFALAVLLVGVFMSMLDSTIVNVALPTIRTDLHGGESTLAWVISGYALAFGLALIPAGRIGDRYGHYTIFIVGLAGFTLASLWCGLSRGATELIVARVVQGFFGGVYYPSVIALLQLMFTGKVRAKAFAIQGAVIGFSTALGPIIGGLLIQGFGGWRSIFFVNLPFGVLAVTAALFLLPRTVAGRSVRGVDFGGLAMLAIGLVAILVPLIEAQSVRWAPWTWMSMAGGLAMLACFALWEMRVQAAGRTPIVPPRLFAHKQFTGGVLLAMVYFGAFTSIFFSLSILW